MEPDYSSLDPEERLNKLLALASFLLGAGSLCSGLIPILGIVISCLGIVAGILGKRSENRKIAMIGITISSLGLLIALVYALFLLVGKLNK